MSVALTYVAWTFVVLLIIASVLPFFRSGSWTVRLFDFPRLQIAAISLIPLVCLAIVFLDRAWTSQHSLLAISGLAVFIWQTGHLLKFSPLWPKQVPEATGGGSDSITVCVMNLKFDNQSKEEVAAELENLELDLLLLVEYDEVWKEVLQKVESRYPYREGVVRGQGLGIMLWSQLPLVETQVKHLVFQRRASIFCEIKGPGGRLFHYIGLHPTPPGLYDDEMEERHDSRIRDAELMLIAKHVAKHPKRNWLIAGDFNDVAWSHTTRMFQRLSGLRDPRVGRGLFTTYHAEYPLLRYPIDHVFVSPNAVLNSMDKFKTPGSDHFAIRATIQFSAPPNESPEASVDDIVEAHEMIAEGRGDATEREAVGGA